MLELTCKELGAPRIAAKLDLAYVIDMVDDSLKTRVLSTAKRFGKARFAQLAGRHVAEATELPGYIKSAVDWLRAE
jgi:putative ATP-dependent endonuclease of OLD family